MSSDCCRIGEIEVAKAAAEKELASLRTLTGQKVAIFLNRGCVSWRKQHAGTLQPVMKGHEKRVLLIDTAPCLQINKISFDEESLVLHS